MPIAGRTGPGSLATPWAHLGRVLLGCAALVAALSAGPAAALDPVTLQLKWTHSYQFAGYYAAKAQGYYREAGLDVTFREAGPAVDPVRAVVDGAAQYGVGTSGLLLERHAGKPVVVLAAVFQHSAYEIYAAPGIRRLEDLVGKRLMLEPQAGEVLFYLRKEGIPLDEIRVVPHSHNVADLIEGRVEAISGYISDQPFALRQAKYPYQTFSPRLAGIDFYGDNLFTSERELRAHPARVKAFRDASLRGWQYAMQHHEEIVDLILATYAPHQPRERLHFQAEQMVRLLQPGLVEIGYMNPARWRSIADTYAGAGLLPPNLPLAGFLYDTDESDLTWVYRSLGLALLLVVGVSGVAIYIFRINRRLRVSEARHRLLADNATDVISTMDLQGRFTYVSPSVEKLRGYTQAEALRHTQAEVLAPASEAMIQAYGSRVAADAQAGRPVEPFRGELEVRRKDGSTVWTEATVSPLLGPAGTVVEFLVVTRDITARRQADAALRARTAQLEALREVSTELTRELDLDRLLDLLVRRAAELVGVESGMLYLWEAGPSRLAPRVYTGAFLHLPHTPVPLGDGLVGQVAATRRGLVVNDYRAWPGAHPDSLARTDLTAVLGEPLLYHDRLVGVIALAHSRGPGVFSGEDSTLLRLFAAQAAVAIENAQLYAATRTQAAQLAQLAAVTQPLTGALEPAQVTQAILQAVPALLPEAAARLWLPVPGQADRFQVAGGVGLRGPGDGGVMRVTIGEGFTGLAIQSHRPVASADLSRDPRLRNRSWVDAEGFVSALTVPLLRGEACFGALVILTRTPHDFTGDEIAVFQALAAQAAIALENAKLYDAAQREIAARTQAEAALQTLNAELEARIRQRTAEVTDLYNNAPCGYHSVNPDGVFIHINDTELRWLGYAREEVVGRLRFHDVVTAKGLATIQENFPILKAQGRVPDLEFDLVRKDGSTFPVLLNATAIADAAGTFIMSRSTLFDLTARRQAEAARRAAEEQLRRQGEILALAQRVARVGTFRKDLVNNRSDWSPELYEILGLDPAQVAASFDAWREILHPEDREEVAHRFAAAAAGKGGYDLVHRIRRPSGEVRWVHAFGMTECDAAGTPVQMAGICLDVTTGQEAEEALRQSRDALEAANLELARAAKLKDEFLASMSHELRTPLNAVLGLSEALQEEVYGPITERQQQSLRNIEASGRHLLGLINDILDLSKVEAGKLTLDPGPVAVSELCQASLQFLKEAALKKRQTLTSTIDPAVSVLVADERRLKQILVNLLTNAMKFTPEEGAFGLEVAGDPERRAVRFTVWDTGIGISEADAAKLFQPFVQIDSSLGRRHGGTGLGLSLVQRLAALHGGSVELASEPGQGSRFSVWIPWQIPEGAPVAAGEEEGVKIASALVVEDIPVHAEQMTRYLQELGAQVATASGGAGVLEQAAAARPDVIMLDLGLPDVSGLTVLAQLKADPRTRALPVVVATVVDDRNRARAAGADAYLDKPFTRGQLQAAVRQAIAAAAASQGAPASPPEPAPASPLILLAEDNPANVTTVVDYLQAKGYRLVVAKDGAEAIALTHEVRPAVILMDIQMPGVDGLEATRRLRADADPAIAGVPIVALTALAMAGDRERCLAAGATAYLTKPVRLRELTQTITGFLGSPPA